MSEARELLTLQTGIEGTVYVLDADHGVKIGISRWAIPGVRQRTIETGAGMPIRMLRAWQFYNYEDACRVEREAHAALKDTRTIGEWFHCHPFEACDAVEKSIRALNCERRAAA